MNCTLEMWKEVIEDVSQRALLRACEARLTGALSKGGKMRRVATNVFFLENVRKTEGNRSK